MPLCSCQSREYSTRTCGLAVVMLIKTSVQHRCEDSVESQYAADPGFEESVIVHTHTFPSAPLPGVWREWLPRFAVTWRGR